VPTRPTVSKLVTAYLAPLLKEHGWTRGLLTFTRRRGETTQVINIQSSHGGRTFYVNIGMVIDAVKKLQNDSTGNQVFGKYTVTHGGRIDEWRRGMPKEFPAFEPETVGPKIRGALERLMPMLDRLDSPTAFREQLDLSRGFDKILRAQLAWLAGNKKAAQADLRAVAKEFADRPAISFDMLAKQAGLKQLIK
jgi:hypothetical protein